MRGPAVAFSFKENFTQRNYSTANSAAAMFSLLTIGFDRQLVILAGSVCLLAAVAAASLFARMRETRGRARTMWIAVGAVTVLCALIAIEVVLVEGAHRTIDHLLRRADMALYNAKMSGRNCVSSTWSVSDVPHHDSLRSVVRSDARDVQPLWIDPTPVHSRLKVA